MRKFIYIFLSTLCLLLFFGIMLKEDIESSPVAKINKSSDFLILVNKENKLDAFYVPTNLFIVEGFDQVRTIFLKQSCYIALSRMNVFLENNNIFITLFSGYRSYSYQEKIFIDDTYQAKPGYSEHQTGFAIDLSTREVGLTLDFQDTIEYKFIKANCYKFGFIIRYPKDKEHITKYPFEPWHLRYVGVKASTYIYNNNICLEEYLSLD